MRARVKRGKSLAGTSHKIIFRNNSMYSLNKWIRNILGLGDKCFNEPDNYFFRSTEYF